MLVFHPTSIFLTPCLNAEARSYDVSNAGLPIAVVLWDHWTVSSVAKVCSLIASFHPISIFKKYSVTSLLFFFFFPSCRTNVKVVGHVCLWRWSLLTLVCTYYFCKLLMVSAHFCKAPGLVSSPAHHATFSFLSPPGVCLLPHAHQI